jgi:hypothetical protein
MVATSFLFVEMPWRSSLALQNNIQHNYKHLEQLCFSVSILLHF